MRTFRDALLFYRSQLGLTQSKMAEKLNLKMRYYQKLESGEAEEPSVGTLSKVLVGLNISYEEFFSRQKPEPRQMAIQPQAQPGWPELARLLQYYGDASVDERLLGLYMLSQNSDYLKQYAELGPDQAADASILTRILATS